MTSFYIIEGYVTCPWFKEAKNSSPLFFYILIFNIFFPPKHFSLLHWRVCRWRSTFHPSDETAQQRIRSAYAAHRVYYWRRERDPLRVWMIPWNTLLYIESPVTHYRFVTGFIYVVKWRKKKLQAHIEEEESALFLFFLYILYTRMPDCGNQKKGKKKSTDFSRVLGAGPFIFSLFRGGRPFEERGRFWWPIGRFFFSLLSLVFFTATVSCFHPPLRNERRPPIHTQVLLYKTYFFF